MPIERNVGGVSDDNHNPNGQGLGNIIGSSQERVIKESSFEVRPDKVTTIERNLLVPLVGEVVFNTDELKNEYWDGSKWVAQGSGGGGGNANAIGWAQYGDSQYTEANPLVATEGSTVLLDIDGLGDTVTSQLPSGVPNLYDTINSKITPVSSGDYYTATLQFKAKSSSSNGDAIVFFDLGGTFTRIFPSSFRFNRGAGVGNEYYLTFGFYSLDTFIANGGLIKIESRVGDSQVYDIILQINKTHDAR